MAPEIVKALVPTGKLRAAINLGNSVLAQQKAKDAAPEGTSVMLAEELGRRLGVPLELVTFDAAAEVLVALKDQRWDVVFVAIEPVRAAEIDFTAPYVIIEGTYLVLTDSPLEKIDHVDRAGIRIGVGRGSAYDLYLTRTIRNAQIVRATTGGGTAAIDLFLKEGLEVVAGVRQQLVKHAKTHRNARVMDGRFMAIQQAIGVPKGRHAAAAFLQEFVEEMKASGFVADALRRTGQADAQVAPPAIRAPAT